MDTTGIRARHRYTLRTGPRGGAIRLLEQLEGLRQSSFPELVLSVYVPVAPGATWGAVADVARELAHDADLSRPERIALDRELPRLRRALEGEWRHVAAVAAFASRPMRIVVGLPEPVEPRLTVAREADIAPLEAQLATHPPAIVAVVDKVGARIFAAAFDRVSLVRTLAGLPIHRHRQGESSAEQWQRRQDDHTARNMSRVAAAIARLARWEVGHFGLIRLAAPDEAAAGIVSRLPAHLRPLVVHEPGLATYLATGELETMLVTGTRPPRRAG